MRSKKDWVNSLLFLYPLEIYDNRLHTRFSSYMYDSHALHTTNIRSCCFFTFLPLLSYHLLCYSFRLFIGHCLRHIHTRILYIFWWSFCSKDVACYCSFFIDCLWRAIDRFAVCFSFRLHIFYSALLTLFFSFRSRVHVCVCVCRVFFFVSSASLIRARHRIHADTLVFTLHDILYILCGTFFSFIVFFFSPHSRSLIRAHSLAPALHHKRVVCFFMVLNS